MKRGAWLLPNFGAEEGLRWKGLRHDRAYREMARLWWTLFRPASRVFDDEAGRLTECWPQALGPAPDVPALDWLEDDGGAVPWLRTPQTDEQFASRGLRTHGPSAEVVRRVHDKGFARDFAIRERLLPDPIADLSTVFEPRDFDDEAMALDRMQALVDGWPEWTARNFTLKPRFHSSGRGRVPGMRGRFDLPEVRGALGRLARQGGAILEPWLDRTIDLSAQFLVAERGHVEFLGSCRQVLSVSGSYFGNRGVIDAAGLVTSGSRFEADLRQTSQRLVEAAHAEAFFGPCGVDAFAFRVPRETSIHSAPASARKNNHADSTEYFRPAVELNARFTWGTVALGLIRRLVQSGALAGFGLPGERLAFHFGLAAPRTGWPVGDDSTLDRFRFVPLGTRDAGSGPALLFARSPEFLDALLAPDAPPSA